jgi:hypothetical protein
MGAKRPDNSLWKILVSDKDKPAELLDSIIQRYKAVLVENAVIPFDLGNRGGR